MGTSCTGYTGYTSPPLNPSCIGPYSIAIPPLVLASPPLVMYIPPLMWVFHFSRMYDPSQYAGYGLAAQTPSFQQPIKDRGAGR